MGKLSEHRPQAILLVEDQQQGQFLRRVLMERGWSNHQIRVLPSPAGRGSGEAFARREYSRQVRAMRRSHVRSCLVVVVDADTQEVESRHRQLAEALASSGEEARGQDELIALLVPRRNVETWFWYLDDGERRPTDEQTDYKPRFGAGTHRSSNEAREFWKAFGDPQEGRPASLLRAFDEIRRLLTPT